MPLIGGPRSSLVSSDGSGLLPRSTGGNAPTDWRRSPVSGLLLPPSIAGFANAGGPYYDLIMSETGLAGYYRLDETSGISALDSSGLAGTGTYVGRPTLGAAGLLTADLDFAAVFTAASSQYVDIAPGAGFGNGPLSGEGWFSMASSGANFSIMQLPGIVGGSGAIGMTMGPLANGKVSVMDGTNTIVNSGATLYNDGAGHYAAFTKSAANVWKLYVDGADVTVAGNFPTQTTSNGSGTDGGIGADYNAGTRRFFFTGTIDEVAFYSVELTPAQVLAHYNMGKNIAAGLDFPFLGGGYYGQAA